MKQEHICKQKKCALKFSDSVYCIHNMIIHIYVWVYILPVKRNKNEHQITHSHSAVHIWVHLLVQRRYVFRLMEPSSGDT
jgi:hypothetical protein